MEIIIFTVIQIIAVLILARTIQENSIEMKKQNIPLETIKATNQRTMIIFLLIEILVIATISSYGEISDMMTQVLLQL